MQKWILLLLVFAGCEAVVWGQEKNPKTEPGAEIAFEKETDWRRIFAGIDEMKLRVKKPRPMTIHVVRIALETPGLEFISTGDNDERPEETDGVFTSTFLKQEKCQVAINAGVFGPVTDTEGTGKNIVGLHISKGKIVSPWQNGRHALVIGKGNEAKIVKAEPKDTSSIETAVTGFSVVLWEGRVQNGDESVHPRTLVGLSKDRKTMYWMVIDGRQKEYSEGAMCVEAGWLMKQTGADTALNLDGGGTSTLVVEGKDGSPKVINRPIHGGVPGKERPSASHLGVRVGKG